MAMLNNQRVNQPKTQKIDHHLDEPSDSAARTMQEPWADFWQGKLQQI